MHADNTRGVCKLFGRHVVLATKAQRDGQVILQKGRIAAAYGRFSHVRQVAPICTPSRCSMAHPCPQPIRHVDRFSGFCKAHDRDRQTDRSRHRQSIQSTRPNYGRPIKQGRPLYFCPVVSSIFFFFFLLSNRKSHSNRK